MLDKLLTASKSELLDKNASDDRAFRALLHNYFAFSRYLEHARAKFANYIGLLPTQYMILIAIAHAPEPLGINQVAEQLHLSGAFVTIEVNKLVADGLVDKSVHPIDARRVQLIVTQEGLSRLTRLAEFQRPVNDALFGMLSREEFKQLSGLLARLAGNGEKAVALAGHIEATMAAGDNQGWSVEIGNKQVRKRAVRR